MVPLATRQTVWSECTILSATSAIIACGGLTTQEEQLDSPSTQEGLCPRAALALSATASCQPEACGDVPAEQSVRSPMSQRRGPHLSRAATRALNVELAQRRRKNRTRRGEGHGGYALPATAPHTRDEDLVDTYIDTPWGRRACGHYTQHGTLLAALQNVLHRAADGLEDEVWL